MLPLKKFQFSLARVLNVRETNEELKKEEFQSAQTYYNEQQQALNELFNEKRNLQQDIEDQAKNKMKMNKIIQYYNYLSDLDEQITIQQDVVNRAEQQVEEAKQNWIEAKKQKKILEKLQERQYQEYKNEYLKSEQKKLDELSLQFNYSR